MITGAGNIIFLIGSFHITAFSDMNGSARTYVYSFQSSCSAPRSTFTKDTFQQINKEKVYFGCGGADGWYNLNVDMITVINFRQNLSKPRRRNILEIVAGNVRDYGDVLNNK